MINNKIAAGPAKLAINRMVITITQCYRTAAGDLFDYNRYSVVSSVVLRLSPSQSSRHGCIQRRHETSVISAQVYQEGSEVEREQKDRWPEGIDKFKPSFSASVLLSPIYPPHLNLQFLSAFEHYLATAHYPQSTYLDRATLIVCDRRLTNVSSIRIRCPSAGLAIGDRGPAAHSLSGMRNVTRNNIHLTHSFFFVCDECA